MKNNFFSFKSMNFCFEAQLFLPFEAKPHFGAVTFDQVTI